MRKTPCPLIDVHQYKHNIYCATQVRVYCINYTCIGSINCNYSALKLKQHLLLNIQWASFSSMPCHVAHMATTALACNQTTCNPISVNVTCSQYYTLYICSIVVCHLLIRLQALFLRFYMVNDLWERTFFCKVLVPIFDNTLPVQR